MSLAARLRGRPEGEPDRTVALLLARHWRQAYDYSAICLAASASSMSTASTVTTASFHQVLGRMVHGGLTGALRPHLLVTVRETVRAWSADDRISALMPELRKPSGGRGIRAAGPMTSEKRQLAARSFSALPAVAQCLLWHTAVEAEHISIPAGLSGLSADIAVDALEQAREQFRAGVVRAHRELAPAKECRFYSRLLDVTIRRGGALLSDVRQHVSECRHCRDAADQLSYFEGELGALGALIAEAVLGWGARRYVESRPGRGALVKRGGGTAGQVGRRSGGGGRHRPPAHIPLPGGALGTARTHSRVLRTGAAMGFAAVFAAVLVIAVSSGDGDSGGSVPPTGMAGSHETRPSGDSDAPSAGSSDPTYAGYPGGSEQGRLRNTATGLCLDIRGGKAKRDAGARPGAEVELAKCSAEASQQWSYEENGLLSSVAHPELCLDSHADDGVIILGTCVAPSAARADEVRYDLTVLGELLPRWHEGLAVAPSSSRKGADAVVKVRDGSAEQRWMLGSSTTAPRPRSVDGKGAPSVKGDGDAARGDGEPSSPGGRRPGAKADGSKGDGARGDGARGDGAKGDGRRSSPDSTRRGDEVQKRYAEVGCCDVSEPVAPRRPGGRLRSPAARAGVPDEVPSPTPSPSREDLTERVIPAAAAPGLGR
ncbi:RICIN domain-containing protein [Streptomyces sp. NPDC048441]|uniref:RICIN domain-containing protein n=1 Tax=Streptomyces sp. NPDC048441 TaxID=3365552 RepID=UPI003711F7B6